MGALLLALALAARAQVPEPGPTVTAEDPASAAFAARLNFDGTAAERTLFEALVRRILESPTNAAFAAQFSARSGKVTTRFAELPGTHIYERREGRTAFDSTTAAHVLRGPEAATIELNRACLVIDPEYALDQCSEELAHEAFGHTLGWLEAGAAGVRDAYVYYDDEFFARLVAWTLQVERGARVRDPEAWCALSHPSEFQQHLSRTYPSSEDSMAHPDEVRRVRENPLGPRLEAREEALRRDLLAKPESFFAVDDCSDYL